MELVGSVLCISCVSLLTLLSGAGATQLMVVRRSDMQYGTPRDSNMRLVGYSFGYSRAERHKVGASKRGAAGGRVLTVFCAAKTFEWDLLNEIIQIPGTWENAQVISP